MRFWEITLFLVIVNVFGAFFTSLLPSLGYTAFPYLDVTSQEVQSAVGNVETAYSNGISQEQITSNDPVTNALGLLYSAVQKVWDGISGIFKQYVFWLPYLMIMFGVPGPFAWGFEAMLLLIQTIGFAQLITGRAMSGVD